MRHITLGIIIGVALGSCTCMALYYLFVSRGAQPSRMEIADGGWVDYVAMEYDERSERLVPSSKSLTETGAAAIAIVLMHYGEPFIYFPDGPRLCISQRLRDRDDKELLWNFTTKAERLDERGIPGAAMQEVGNWRMYVGKSAECGGVSPENSVQPGTKAE